MLQTNTPAGWQSVIADLGARRQAAQDHAAELRRRKSELSLEAALGSDAARKELAAINKELQRMMLEGDDFDAAVAQAEVQKRQAEATETEAKERSRRDQISAALQKYFDEVQEIDGTMRLLSAKFASSRDTLARAIATMKPGEAQPLQQLLTSWGGTCAACAHGLSRFMTFGPEQSHPQHHQPLAKFAAAFVSGWLPKTETGKEHANGR